MRPVWLSRWKVGVLGVFGGLLALVGSASSSDAAHWPGDGGIEGHIDGKLQVGGARWFSPIVCTMLSRDATTVSRAYSAVEGGRSFKLCSIKTISAVSAQKRRSIFRRAIVS